MVAIKRRKSKTVAIGDITIGGESPIAIQSMTNTPTHDIDRTVSQIEALEQEGCEIVRCAVPDERAVKALPDIIKQISIPLVADIHFRADLGVAAIQGGVHKIRINPGNIGNREKINSIIETAKSYGIPVRIGVNSGSLGKDILEKYGHPSGEALAESMLQHVDYFEKAGFDNLVLSVKSTSLAHTINATRLIASKTDYPLHVGITEAGTAIYGSIKSATGLGVLLYEGIGNTLRVSLSGDPLNEVKTAKYILKAWGLRVFGPEIITCPTCGRTKIDVEKIALAVEKETAHMKLSIKIAIMGCEVNGPGEAQEADIGVACGDKNAVLFVQGNKLRTVNADTIVHELLTEIKSRFFK